MIKLIKRLIKYIPIAFTQNQKYDKQTTAVIKKVCSDKSNCIDVGCHKGEVLDIFFKYAPAGTHYGFEPIPSMFQNLQVKYKNTQAKLFELAISNTVGESTFNYVVSNPSYSGLIRRKYDNTDEVDQQIIVKKDLMDNVIPANIKIDMIKIDVEGGELLVLEGAVNIIKNSRPVIIFEHGLGASEFYDSTPEKIFKLLTKYNMKISTMYNWLNNKPHFSLNEFQNQFNHKINYYFIAY